MYGQVSSVYMFQLIAFLCLLFFNLVIATKITCNPTATAELCPNTTLFCTCTGTGTAMRWTTNKTGVFDPPTGVTFSADFDDVNDSHTQGGLIVVLINKTMSNFISTLQVNATDVDGVQVSCSIGGVTDTITPQLAAIPRYPTLMTVPPTSCDPMSGNQINLQWTPPTDTGGPGVNIIHYVVDVTGPAGVTCLPEPCNVISGTNTTITGLLCNANYTVTVRAVNCRGQGTSSTPVVLSTPASVILKCENLHQLCPYSSAQRICTCTIIGSAVRWRTSLNGVFSNTAGVVLNSLSDMHTAMGFTVTLTNTASNNLTSMMTYTPSSVPPNRLVVVSCDDPNTHNTTQTETAAITFKAVPTPPQVTAVVSCDLVSGSYQVMLQWNGDTSHTHYQVEVTSPAGFMCPPKQCNITTTTTTITGLSCATNYYSLTVRAVNCVGQGDIATLTVSLQAIIVTPMISKACLIDNRVDVAWTPPSSGGDRSCVTVDSYSLVIFNNTGVQLGTLMIGGHTTGVSVGVANSDYYNITLTANTNCGTSTGTSAVVSSACTATSIGLGVGIPVTFVLTATIASLVASFITYLCLTGGGSHKFTSPVQEPAYDPMSSGTRVEMKSNVAYGQVTTGGHVTYETVAQ